MISLMPGTTAADTQGAFAVLNLLSDDSKFKKRLEELVAAAQEAYKMIEAAKAESKKAEADKLSAQADLEAAKQITAEANGRLEKADLQQAALIEYERSLQAKEKKLQADSDRAFSAREEAVTNKEVEITNRLNDVINRENILGVNEGVLKQKIREDKADFDKKFAEIQMARNANADEAASLRALRKELEDKVAQVNRMFSK